MSDVGRAAFSMLRRLPPVLALLVLLATSAAADPPKRTLEELIALSHSRAAAVAVADAQLDVYKSQRTEARRLWAPFAEFNYYLTGAPSVQCVAPDPNVYVLRPGVDVTDPAIRRANCIRTVAPTGSSITFFSFNLAGVGMQGELRLVQPLYTFGKIEYAKSAAEHGVRAGQAGIDSARRDAELQVIRAYWGLKAARASLAIVQQGRDEIAPWVDKINKDLDSDAPRYSETDLLRIKVALAQVDILTSNLERGEAIAREGLRTVVGEEVDVDESELNPVDVADLPVSHYQTQALLHRPEITQLDEGLAATRDIARVRRSELLPDLAIAGGFNFRYTPTIEDSQSAFENKANQFGYSVLLTFRQPLDFAQKVARWRHAGADAELLAARRRLAVDGIHFEIARAYADLTEARKRLMNTERGQRTAQGLLTAIRQNLDLGTVTPRDLVDAARSYFELRLGYFQSIMDVNVALAVLRRAAGLELMH
ncbi:MAG TPA: TolC family protein [Polyangia bacterium]|jgi:outer membrane protein TolC|nr:TolC family protein [Polyangia bacterium]